METRFISTFLLVFLFLGSFVVLISWMPTEFMVATKEYAESDLPEGESWKAIYLQEYNQSIQIRLNDTTQAHIFDIGGRNLQVSTISAALGRMVILSHLYGFDLMGQDDMDWHNEADTNLGSHIYGSMLDDNYDEFGKNVYVVYCYGTAGAPVFGYSSKFHVGTQVSFNLTLYDTPDEAWDNNDLWLAIGIEFNQYNTSLNAWDMIARLLTFQKIEVFGTSPEAQAMNTIMSYAFWACIAAMAMIVVFELIPF